MSIFSSNWLKGKEQQNAYKFIRFKDYKRKVLITAFKIKTPEKNYIDMPYK